MYISSSNITSWPQHFAVCHGLRTPNVNEGIHQRYLKNWADVADKIRFGRTLKVGIGNEILAAQWDITANAVVTFLTKIQNR